MNRHRTRQRAHSTLLLLLLLGARPALAGATDAAPTSSSGEVLRHVIIIGVNWGVDEGMAALDYADDDAARYAEALQPGAASLHLLTVLDADTQGRFPQLARVALTPRRAVLEQTVSQVFARMEEEQALGGQTELLFIYTGHGAVDKKGEGYVSLLDGPLMRGDLFGVVIAPSPARFNHIVVDACSAYHLLNRGPDEVQAVRALLEKETLAAYPNTGAVLATSRDRATHEWTRIGGGVFSHEILSALNGAADVDDDGQIRYAEIGAFIEAANQDVADRRARIDLFLQPPALDLGRPLWTRAAEKGPRLTVRPDDAGHLVVADARGVPVAEVHKNREQALTISLRGQAPFSVALDDAHWVTDPSPQGDLDLASLLPDPDDATPRSAISAALERGLFQVPFGKSYVLGYQARLVRELDRVEPRLTQVARDPAPLYRAWGGGALAGAGLAFLLSAGGFALAGVELTALQQGEGRITAFEADTHAALATVGLWSGGLLAATGLAGLATGVSLLLVPDDPSAE